MTSSRVRWHTVLCLVGSVVPAAAASAHDPRAGAKAHRPSGEERAAFVEAKPVFQKHCYRCHTSTGLKAKPKAMKHLKMDRYPFTGPHSHEAAAVILRALAGDKEKGEKPTMPADDLGALSDAELRKVLAWADAFERSRAQASKRPAAPTSPAPSPHDHHGGSK